MKRKVWFKLSVAITFYSHLSCQYSDCKQMSLSWPLKRGCVWSSFMHAMGTDAEWPTHRDPTSFDLAILDNCRSVFLESDC